MADSGGCQSGCILPTRQFTKAQNTDGVAGAGWPDTPPPPQLSSRGTPTPQGGQRFSSSLLSLPPELLLSIIREDLTNLPHLSRTCRALKTLVTQSPYLWVNLAIQLRSRERALTFALNNGCTDLEVISLLLDCSEFRNATLVGAAEDGSAGVVQLLLRRKGDTLEPAVKELALRQAARRGFLTVVELLLEAGTQPSPLAFELAAHSEDRRILMRLLETTKPTQEDVNAAFRFAVGHGKLETAEWLLREHGAEPQNSGVFSAVRHGHVATVRLLLNHGVPVSSSMLAEAASAGHADVVELLLQYGARPRQEHVVAAARGGNFRALRLLTAPSQSPWGDGPPTLPDGSALTAALLQGTPEQAEYLLALGVEPDAHTVLSAARADRADILRFLLANRPALFKPSLPQKALDAAVDWLHAGVVRILVESGVRPKENHLLFAARKGNLGVFRALVEYPGSDEDGAADCTDPKLMDAACRGGSREVVGYLVERGAAETPSAKALLKQR